MPLIDQIREDKLIELAQKRFNPELWDAEKKVLHDSASSEDVPEPDEKAPRPEVRADFLRWLATDPEVAPHIDPKGLRVYAATIPGKLDLEECHVNPTLDFRCCNFQGEIYLQSSETRGLYFIDSSLAAGMSADRAIIHGPLFLQVIHSVGAIRMIGAEITGELDCNGAKLKADDTAFYADGAKIGGDVILTDGFESEGEILLLGAEITGQLTCSGAKLRAKGNALSADGAKIGGDVFLDDGFESEGEIRLLGAKITGALNCSGAKLRTKGDALSVDRAKIGGSVILTDGFESKGAIRLPGAEIGGDLAVRGVKVARVVVLNTVVKGDLVWQRIEKSKDTDLNLMGARVKNLRDDIMSWPDEENLDIDGLVYEELTLHALSSVKEIKDSSYPQELPLVAKERIEWILLQPDKRCTEPQPWMQLRDLLERKGDRKGAKYVLFRFRCLQAQKSWILWRWLKVLFARLEENPLRIIYTIAVAVILGLLVFGYAGSRGALAPTEPEMYKAFTSGKPMPAAYPTLNPFVYTIENAIPLMKLGQDEKWAPDRRYPGTNWFTNYWFLMWSRWLLILSGWVQATVLATALSGRFKP
jgi:hypothetical protein